MTIRPFSIFLLGGLLLSCAEPVQPAPFQGIPFTFASDIRGSRLHDVTVLAYDSGGSLVTCAYSDHPSDGLCLTALPATPYHVYALANCGRIDAPSNLRALASWRLALPDLDSLRSTGGYPLISLSAGETAFSAGAPAVLPFQQAGTPLHVAIDCREVSGCTLEVTGLTLSQGAADLRPFGGTAAAREGLSLQSASEQERLAVTSGDSIPFLVIAERTPVITVEARCRHAAGTLPCRWTYTLGADAGETLPLPWGRGYTLTLHLSGDDGHLIGQWTLRRNSQAIL